MPLNIKPESVIISNSDWENINKTNESLEKQNMELFDELREKKKLLAAVEKAGVIIEPMVLVSVNPKLVVVPGDEVGSVARVVIKADV